MIFQGWTTHIDRRDWICNGIGRRNGRLDPDATPGSRAYLTHTDFVASSVVEDTIAVNVHAFAVQNVDPADRIEAVWTVALNYVVVHDEPSDVGECDAAVAHGL